MIESISIDRLTIAFPNLPPVIKNLSISFERGKTYLITGTTASGKSTLLRFLKGIIPLFYPATILGKLKVNEKKVTIEEFWDYRTEISYLFQDPGLQVIGSSVEKDIAFGLENLAVSSKKMKQKIMKISNKLNIANLLSRSVAKLSGGELALVALASILVLQPQIVILDEFSAYLDNIARKNVIKMIKQIQSPDRIIIIVSHQIHELMPLIDEIIVMDNGEILAQEPVKNFYSTNYGAIENKIRIPEFYRVGVELCEILKLPLKFQSPIELLELLKVMKNDHT
ncbi:MAG: energy-coupling factor ABC transporter ATP-binding protein [Candidatus Hodarchaeales archaeon]|jgi:energy-coupling factor transporter ATP-binding protein EcfA2